MNRFAYPLFRLLGTPAAAVGGFALLSCCVLQSSATPAQNPAGGQGTRDTKPMQPNDKPLHLQAARSAISQARQVVIHDAKTFANLWAEHTKGLETPPPIPTVDFKKQDVIAVFAGSKPSGGYTVEIGDAVRTSKKAVVPVTVYKPGPGAMVAQVFTSPFALRAVPKLPAGVTFQVVEKAR